MKFLIFSISVGALLTISPSATAQRVPPVAPPSSPSPQASQPSGASAPGEHEWAATGFVGPNFGSGFDDTQTGFGGSIAYLHNRRIGGEALVSATPGLGTTKDVLEDSGMDSYMGNVIAAVPFGRDGSIQPFVSGGVGAMRLRALVPQTGVGSVEIDDSRFGANVGAGLMWFRNRWGFRTDIRYYDALGEDEFDTDDEVRLPQDADSVLTEGNFWQYNLGVAYRW
jgi:opacity protein-like surface antigen